jgi:hypothetical protein
VPLQVTEVKDATMFAGYQRKSATSTGFAAFCAADETTQINVSATVAKDRAAFLNTVTLRLDKFPNATKQLSCTCS